MSITLTPARAARPVTVLAALARHHAENLSVTPQFDATSRWYARIGGDPDHEAWLLTWLPGQATDLHDHGGSAGAFFVVSGELTEQVVRRDATLVDTTLVEGQVRPFGPRHVHRIVNAGTDPAVSLHVYAPALREMTRYRLNRGVLSVAAVEKAGVDW